MPAPGAPSPPDPWWPTAAAWLRGELAAEDDPAPTALELVGAPTSAGSRSPSEAWATPGAVRSALHRFAPFDGGSGRDLTRLRVRDRGDAPITALPLTAALETLRATVGGPPAPATVRLTLGGDNAVTRPLTAALGADRAANLDRVGLLTFDAHHDVRALDHGPGNGTPVRGLIEEEGLPGRNVVQIGIHPFANASAYRRWCEERGVTVVTVAEVERRGADAVTDEALAALAARCDRVHVDIDVDVLDRAFVPACPGARPGGLAPTTLEAAVRRCGAHPAVVSADLVEVDANAPGGGATVLVAAHLLLAFAAGVAARGRTAGAP